MSTANLTPAIRIKDLRKIYHSPPPLAASPGFAITGGRGAAPKQKKKVKIVALDGITLEAAAGSIFGLLGPNGAGKSTTVGILTTRIRPTSGEAYLGEYNVWRQQ